MNMSRLCSINFPNFTMPPITALCVKPQPIMLKYLPIMLLSNAQKINIMPMTTTIIPPFVHDLNNFND